MKVLITGGTGRLGSITLRKFLNEGWDVVSLVRHSSEDSAGGEEIVTDFDNYEELKSLFVREYPDVVIHLAAMTGGQCENDPALAHKVNVDLTERLARISSLCGVARFVFASTAAVYNQTSLAATDEYSNVNPLSVYGKTKLAAEQEIATIAQQSNTRFFSLRIFNIYGPGFDLSLINKLLSSRKDEPAELIGYDNYYRDYIHAEEVAHAISKCADSTEVATSSPHIICNIASGKALSNRQVVDYIKAQGRSVYCTVVGDQVSYSWADMSNARTKINFLPSDGLIIAEQ